jgi:hypothetical protein
MVLLFSDGGVRIATARSEKEESRRRARKGYVSEAEHCIRNLTLLGI